MNRHDHSYTSPAADAERKRAAARKLIEQYYSQLTEGCGCASCDNEHCASSPLFQALKPNQAAALALQLFKTKARICTSGRFKGRNNENNKHSELCSPSEDMNVVPSESCSADVPESTSSVGETTCNGPSCSIVQSSSADISTLAFSEPTETNTSAKKMRCSDGQSILEPLSSNSIENSQQTSGAEITDVQMSTSTILNFVSSTSPTKVSETSLSEILSPSGEQCSMDTSEQESNIAPQSSNTMVPCDVDTAQHSLDISPSTSGLTANSVDFSEGKSSPTAIEFLDESRLLSIIAECREQQSYSLLIRTIGQVFSKEECLQLSFTKQTKDLCKEDIRAMEVDEDKDKDSKEVQDIPTTPVSPVSSARTADITVDIDSLRRAFRELFSISEHPFQRALINALMILSENLEFTFKYKATSPKDGSILNIFVIIMEIPMLECPEYMDSAFPSFCKAAALLPAHAQSKLARFWSTYEPVKLKEMVDTIHQFITLKVITGQFNRDFCINDDEAIVAATKLMKVLYYADMVGGLIDREPVVVDECEDVNADNNLQDMLPESLRDSKESKQTKEDPLGQELNIKPIDCRTPVINFEEFYNEPLSDQLEMDRDFACYKTDGGKFSFMNYSFILTPAVKALGLYYDNRIRMYSERRMSVFRSLMHGDAPNPYLKLKIRRDHIVNDALVYIEMWNLEDPNNLKKQLVVEFEGEQGIDEGGVSKEFFQLIVDEIFNPDLAMFTLNPETQLYWFNPTSFETDAEFKMIGFILGLAIYNNIILDVHFPMVLYRKLMGKRGTFIDLQDWNPALSKGLQDLLNYEGDDIESVFLQTFRITHQDIFGTVLVHDLKESGDQIMVNQSNKKEFVELYADFLLNKSCEKQFREFKKGFQQVTDGSPLKMLFRPDEIELLVCGSKNFDFNALEESTDYDGGYLPETPIIRWFWELVHEFSLEQKRKLLQFTTGSDRVPVGGLSKLKLVIARHGPDSDRLPTAHTCFNVLLLPEYSSKEKLEERLLKAINYSKGFGML